MLDKIVELDNNENYVILNEQVLDNNKYYLGLKLDEHEEPTNEYLFFQETKEGITTYLTPIIDESLKGVLLTTFTTDFLGMSYGIDKEKYNEQN